MTYRKKMIEVSIPLDAINVQSAREKSIRHGHPSTLHLWWARRPLAACRAVIFCSLIDDPGEEGIPERETKLIDGLPTPDPRPLDWDDMDVAQQRRERLFAFIGKLVRWENSNDERVIGQARELIMAATNDNPPPVLDPFCGGGSIPLEAQRLGLKAYASDLNPVAVLITKALVEIPPKFANQPPVNPDARRGLFGPLAGQKGDGKGQNDANPLAPRTREGGGEGGWKGAAGLAEDVRYYGKWMRDEAWKRIGHLYPKGPNGETVIAWLWARTVKCPNPACGGDAPLIRSYAVSTKANNSWQARPLVNPLSGSVTFAIEPGLPVNSDGTVTRSGASCIHCGASIPFSHIRKVGYEAGLGAQCFAVVAEGGRSRTFLAADSTLSPTVEIPDTPELEAEISGDTRDFRTALYGLPRFKDLFTPRQLVALTTFSGLVGEARELARKHAVAAGLRDDPVGIADGGTGAQAYADAVSTYLGLASSKLATSNSTITRWRPGESKIAAWDRQALPMVWDYAETNPFAGAGGDFGGIVTASAKVVASLGSGFSGAVAQIDAAAATPFVERALVVTDPPYYDNVGYSDLSDYFYVWLRQTLQRTYPDLFSTLLTPKFQELVATPVRFNGDKKKAQRHFEEGLGSAVRRLKAASRSGCPMGIYYAFRQAEEIDSGVPGRLASASTGWETFLSGLISAGIEIQGSWPFRTENATRTNAALSNALASSVVIVGRPQGKEPPVATLREFNTALTSEIGPALDAMITGHVAPVDLAQSVIGPGMAVFSRYAKVIEPDGSAMTVRRALELINNAVENYMAEREGSMDRDTQFCVHWFEENRFQEGAYGQAEVLARAKNVGIDALARAGVLTRGQGKVQLVGVATYAEQVAAYDPALDSRISAWEACHYLAAALQHEKGGEELAGQLARRLGGIANDARDLAYRLYAICEQKGWSEEGQIYNLLADSWPAIQAEAAKAAEETQAGLL